MRCNHIEMSVEETKAFFGGLAPEGSKLACAHCLSADDLTEAVLSQSADADLLAHATEFTFGRYLAKRLTYVHSELAWVVENRHGKYETPRVTRDEAVAIAKELDAKESGR